jgi:hypothetical protein
MERKMDKDILNVFERYLPDLKFDKKLYTAIQRFRIGWMQKSDEYLEFLGGNLLGVQQIRFSTRDDSMFFTDILNLDLNMIKDDLHRLDGINPEWSVTSNPAYLTLGYIMHKFMTSKDIGSYKENAVREVYYIFAYKVFSSKISNGFKYPADKNLAMATYEKLSNRFLIKKLGSWQAVFEYRSNDITDKKGLHYKNITTYHTENATNMIMDIQGRLGEAFKNVYRVMMDIKENGGSMTTTSQLEMGEDGETIKDITHRPDMYISYLYNIIGSRNDLIKDELLNIITITLPNTKLDVLKATLIAISDSDTNKANGIDDIVDPIISISIKYLNSKQDHSEYTDDTLNTLTLLKNYWGGSKTTNPNIIKIKKYLDKLIVKTTNKKTKWVRSTTVLGVVLYIFLRTVSKNAYR